MFENSQLSNHTTPRSLLLLSVILGTAAIIGALAANQMIVAFGAFLLVLLGVMVFVQVDNIILVALVIIYTNAAVIAVNFHGLPFIIGGLIVPTMLTIALAYNLVFRRQKIVVDPALWLLLGFLVVQILGTLYSQNVSIAMERLLTFFSEGVILYFLIINVIRTPRTMRRAIWTLLIVGTFLGGLSLYQQITGTFHNNYWGFAQVDGKGFGTGVESLQGEVKQARLDGPIGEKNYYAQIMLVLIPLGLFQFQSERSQLLRLLAAIATLVIFSAIVLTFSRGVAVGFVLMLLIMTIMRYIRIHQLVLILVGIYLLFQLFPQYGLRLSSLQAIANSTEEDSAGISGVDNSTQGRIGEMLAAWQVFLDHPILGVGPGMFNFYYPEYAERIGLRTHTGTRAAHDLYLGLAANHGIFGVLLFLSIFIVTLRSLINTRKRWRFTRPDVADMATGLLLALIAYLTTGLFLSLAFERYLWLMLGLAGAVHHISDTLPFQKMELSKNPKENARYD